MITPAYALLLGLLSLVIAAGSLLFLKLALAQVPYRLWLLHPYFYFYFYFFTNGPLRGLVLAINWDVPTYGSQTGGDLILGLALGTLVFASTSILVFLFQRRSAPVRLVPTDVDTSSFLLTFGAFLFFICALGTFYSAAVGRFNVFEAGFTTGRMTVDVHLASAAAELVPACTAVFLVVLLRAPAVRKWAFIGLAACISLFMVRAVFGGSRGYALFSFQLILAASIFTSGYIRSLKILVPAGVAVGALILLISAVRLSSTNVYYFGVESLRDLVSSLSSSGTVLFSRDSIDVYTRALWRLTFNLDQWSELIRLSQDRFFPPEGKYAAGSLVDLARVLPARILNYGSYFDPSYQFNMYMGDYLISDARIDYPVGRVGEVLYTGLFVGGILTVFHAFFMAWMFRTLMLSKSVTLVSIYMIFLLLWGILGTATIFWGLVKPVKVTLYFLVMYIPFRFIYSALKGRRVSW